MSERAPASAEQLKRMVVETMRITAPTLLSISHRLQADPETAWQEHRAVEFLRQTLTDTGFAVNVGVAGLPTAFVATAGGGPTVVAMVAEYDALPGLGHACGHNIIAAAAVGAALGLQPLAEQLDLTIRVIGTPAEEGGGGKIIMLDHGIFDDVELALMIHPGPVDAGPARPLAVAHFDVEYTGHSAHASAYPQLGVNAADAFTVAQVAIGLLRQQLAEPVRVHGIVWQAGTAPNAIPATASGSWYVRAQDLEQLDQVFSKVVRCFEAGALATGCTLDLTETSGRYSEFRNDPALLQAFATNAAALGRDLDPADRSTDGMNTASTDMGNVSQVVRAIHPYLGIDSLPAVNHQTEFAAATVTGAADRAVLDGAVLLAQTVIDDILAGPPPGPTPRTDTSKEVDHV